jgi:hypothetical protein
VRLVRASRGLNTHLFMPGGGPKGHPERHGRTACGLSARSMHFVGRLVQARSFMRHADDVVRAGEPMPTCPDCRSYACAKLLKYAGGGE